MADIAVGGNRTDLVAGGAAWKGRSGAPTPDGSQDKVVGGTVTPQSGDATKTVFNIPHGLGVAPRWADFQPSTNAANATRLVTVTATNIVVTYGAALAAAANNFAGLWVAVK